MRNINKLAGVAAGAALLAAAPGAQALVIATSGTISEIAAPASVVHDALTSNSEMKVFEERHKLVLGSGLGVNWLYTTGTAGSLAAGTYVDSHLIHGDIPASEEFPKDFSGMTVTFDGIILGLIYSDALLDASDLGLGAPVTTYPTGTLYRGFNDAAEAIDTFTVSGNTLTFDAQVAIRYLDQIRVVTAAPEPGTLALLGLGLAGLGGMARARRRA